MNKIRILLLLFTALCGALCSGIYLYLNAEETPYRIDSGTSAQLVKLARDYLHTPYRRGGTDPDGFDCSGFVRYIYRLAGFTLPRTTQQMFRRMRPVHAPLPGELLFFDPEGHGITHTAIYLGKGQFIHAPRPGRTVSIESLSNSWWAVRYHGARGVKP